MELPVFVLALIVIVIAAFAILLAKSYDNNSIKQLKITGLIKDLMEAQSKIKEIKDLLELKEVSTKKLIESNNSLNSKLNTLNQKVKTLESSKEEPVKPAPKKRTRKSSKKS